MLNSFRAIKLVEGRSMNNKSLSNPIYKKLFPETYEKNLKLQATLASFMNKSKYSNKLEEVTEHSETKNEV
mgnify:FL=1